MSIYANPVYGEYFADPFVWRHEGTYYAVGTAPSDRSSHRVLPILRSRDLTQWERVGEALERPDPALGDTFWAPEVAFANGRFYLYYSVGFEDRSHQLRVATSDSPAGPYEDVGVALIPPDECPFAIDAHPFRDDDGSWYLFFAHDVLERGGPERVGTALAVARLTSMTQLDAQRVVIARARYDWQRFQKDRPMYGDVFDWHTLEGPSVRKHGGRYYCFYSGGRWENDTYGVDYVASDHPLGPWTEDGDAALPRVLRTVPQKVLGPGHNSVVVGPDDESEFIVYHAWDAGMTARRMCVDRLLWTPDGPRCLGPTSSPQTVPQ